MSDRSDADLDRFETVLRSWLTSTQCTRAVAECTSRFGYASADVQQQLQRVVERCSAAVMRDARRLECGIEHVPDDAPERVLVLASGRMPGLVLEGIAAAFAVGAQPLVRPSRDEAVFLHVLAHAAEVDPELASRIHPVGINDEPVPWEQADAAIVFGSDATINLVTQRLPDHAAARVAAYGSRQGVAVAAAGVERDIPDWADRLADDVLAFRQQGCMSPSWLYVVGSDLEATAVVDAFGAALAHARSRHLAPGVDGALQQRRTADADVLAAIAAGFAPDPSVLHAGDARVTVVRVASVEDALLQIRQLGSLQQTAVLALAEPERSACVERLLAQTGITRTCAPGQAHHPDPRWPQDGIGRVAPLLAQ